MSHHPLIYERNTDIVFRPVRRMPNHMHPQSVHHVLSIRPASAPPKSPTRWNGITTLNPSIFSFSMENILSHIYYPTIFPSPFRSLLQSSLCTLILGVRRERPHLSEVVAVCVFSIVSIDILSIFLLLFFAGSHCFPLHPRHHLKSMS